MIWRWRYDSIPGMPEDNMAIDAGLLEEVQNPEMRPIIRIYTWDRSCVSIGRLQDEASVRAACPGLPLVRRPTGGRAVVHGEDLCITVAARLTDIPIKQGKSILSSYQWIAGILKDAFTVVGVDADFGGGARGSQEAHWNCFASCARCDLLDIHTGNKLAGCAQRRSGCTLLQQMSVPTVDMLNERMFLDAVRDAAAARFEIAREEMKNDDAPMDR